MIKIMVSINHIKVKHPNTITCETCDQKFTLICELEEHLLSVHGEQKQYFCGVCKSGFVLKWRLQKHLDSHNVSKVRKCHYYNNGK